MGLVVCMGFMSLLFSGLCLLGLFVVVYYLTVGVLFVVALVLLGCDLASLGLLMCCDFLFCNVFLLACNLCFVCYRCWWFVVCLCFLFGRLCWFTFVFCFGG